MGWPKADVIVTREHRKLLLPGPFSISEMATPAPALFRLLRSAARYLWYLPLLIRDTCRILYYYNTRLDLLSSGLDKMGVSTGAFYVLGFPFPSWATKDPDVVQILLGSTFEAFEKGPFFRSRFQDLLGSGIFNTDGEHWRLQRKIASHIFSGRSLREFMTACFTTHIAELMDRVERLRSEGLAGHGIGRNGQFFDIQDAFYRFTMDSIGEIAFGTSIGCLSHDDVPFAQAFDFAQESVQQRFTNPLWKLETLWSHVPLVGGLFCGRRARKLRKDLLVLDAFAHDIISRRAVDPDCSAKSDLLSQFITYSRSEMEGAKVINGEFLRDVIMNFIIAGRDTTAIAMSWCIHLIATHAEVEAKVLEEVDQVLQGRKVDFQSAGNLPYLRAVMHEAMRLFPPVPFDMKECVADTLLPNGINVKAGQIVMYIMYAMGRDKSRWGEDAAEFKPERFLAGRRRTAFEYPVFNAGPRTCLGQNMAILEAVMVLSSLFQRYTFEGDVSTKVQYGITVTLPVKGGLAVRAIPRR